jgi:NitT/TauT family transport system ATP-binding protein
MAPNPGRIQKIIDVQLPHPRERTDSSFAAFRRELFEEFHLVHRQAFEAAEYVI